MNQKLARLFVLVLVSTGVLVSKAAQAQALYADDNIRCLPVVFTQPEDDQKTQISLQLTLLEDDQKQVPGHLTAALIQMNPVNDKSEAETIVATGKLVYSPKINYSTETPSIKLSLDIDMSKGYSDKPGAENSTMNLQAFDPDSKVWTPVYSGPVACIVELSE